MSYLLGRQIRSPSGPLLPTLEGAENLENQSIPQLHSIGLPKKILPPPGHPYNLFDQMIQEVIDHYHENPVMVPDGFMVRFFMASIVTEPKTFETKLFEAKRWAFGYSKSPSEFFRSLEQDLIPEEVRREYRIHKPPQEIQKHLTKQKPKPKPLKVIPGIPERLKAIKRTRRGLSWMLTTFWVELSPCARAVFLLICDWARWPQKEDDFPWVQVGIKQLSRWLGYSERQIKRSLKQLQRFGLIFRFLRGWEGFYNSKYYVLFTPLMSGKFYWLLYQRKIQAARKK